ncbi:sporulation protein [Pseudalkalibacillus berkeleyi]|uniref:Sporulation protein n=1 Tax=Pseudalkalibacillus berkeleyi TaxID=1069813 RepID=A0ABS9H4W9_9BACL|nr:sporulation protein [Pseudalkalibacillus berkeleyi]MCF6138966.1 sporulation protein [Pseudalkalibacillus berkeleyi]
MSFVNRMLASVGVGAAVVDTKLKENTFQAGGNIQGVVEVQGGKVDQNIDDIYIYLMTEYLREVDDRTVTETHVLGKYHVADSFTVTANESMEIPFEIPLSHDVPLSMGKTPIWLKTALDIKQAVDPTDHDYITVIPNELVDRIFTAVEQLGFRLRKSSCLHVKGHMQRNHPFVQEFEYVPTSGPFQGELDEIELIIYPDQNHVQLMIEVDKRGKGLFGFLEDALDLDEQKSMMNISRAETEDVQSLKDMFENHIRSYM